MPSSSAAGLQFEIEAAAEPLAQRQAPGPIDPRAQRRMDHQLHAARLVEEPLEDDLLAVGTSPIAATCAAT